MFSWFYDAFEAIRAFMELGGDVLFLIALIIIRLYFRQLRKVDALHG